MHVGYIGRFDRLHAQPDPLLHLCSNRSILVPCRGRFNAQTEIHNAYRCFVIVVLGQSEVRCTTVVPIVGGGCHNLTAAAAAKLILLRQILWKPAAKEGSFAGKTKMLQH